MNNLAIIVARSKNNIIGSNGFIPWHCPQDLKRFKRLTTGHYIVMGRKTYESIGRPLPRRINIVLTKNKGAIFDGCTTVNSMDEAVNVCLCKDKTIFFIGGFEIYKAALALADTVYLTEIHKSVKGNVEMPKFNAAQWIEESRASGIQEEPEPMGFDFVVYRRR